MIEFKQVKIKRNNKSIPDVIFASNEIALEVSDWFDLKMTAEEFFGLILLRLGFKADDHVLFGNYDKNEHSFQCLVNDKDVYDVKFKNIDFGKSYTEVIINKGDIEYGYGCVPREHTELGMIISLAWYRKKLINGMEYMRVLSSDSAKFLFRLGDYSLEFEVDKPTSVKLSLFDDNGRYSKYRVNNEDKLVEYLSSLTFPNSIVDIYKKICEISLSDVGQYPKFFLKVSKKLESGEMVITDLIDLKYGNMEFFTMTKDGKTVTINDRDKTLECSSLNQLFKFSVSPDNTINCSFSAKDIEEMANYSQNLIFRDFGESLEESVYVRKLATETFPRRR